MPEVEVGTVADFFARPVVAGIELPGSIKVGDRLHILGHTTDLEMVVEVYADRQRHRARGLRRGLCRR